MITKKDFKALMKRATDPNEAPVALQAINDGFEELFNAHETQTTAIAEKDATIASLRDTNMKLFLRATGEPSGEHNDHEETDEEIFERLFTVPATEQLKKGD